MLVSGGAPGRPRCHGGRRPQRKESVDSPTLALGVDPTLQAYLSCWGPGHPLVGRSQRGAQRPTGEFTRRALAPVSRRERGPPEAQADRRANPAGAHRIVQRRVTGCVLSRAQAHDARARLRWHRAIAAGRHDALLAGFPGKPGGSLVLRCIDSRRDAFTKPGAVQIRIGEPPSDVRLHGRPLRVDHRLQRRAFVLSETQSGADSPVGSPPIHFLHARKHTGPAMAEAMA